MKLKAPNGAVIDAADEAVARLLESGFAPVEKPKPAPKRRTTTRKRPAKGE